jgi:hypothetical protein
LESFTWRFPDRNKWAANASDASVAFLAHDHATRLTATIDRQDAPKANATQGAPRVSELVTNPYATARTLKRTLGVFSGL